MKKSSTPSEVMCCICHKPVDASDVPEFGHCKTKRRTDIYFHISCARQEMENNAKEKRAAL